MTSRNKLPIGAQSSLVLRRIAIRPRECGRGRCRWNPGLVGELGSIFGFHGSILGTAWLRICSVGNFFSFRLLESYRRYHLKYSQIWNTILKRRGWIKKCHGEIIIRMREVMSQLRYDWNREITNHFHYPNSEQRFRAVIWELFLGSSCCSPICVVCLFHARQKKTGWRFDVILERSQTENIFSSRRSNRDHHRSVEKLKTVNAVNAT